MEFEHVTLGQRVLFGTGQVSTNIAREARRLGSRRIMAIASKSEASAARASLNDVPVALWWHNVAQHVPVEVAESARSAAAEAEIDLIVCVGGGSTTGLAKAVALTSGIPVVAVPTTYAGSEATNMWGITENRTKTTGIDDKVLPVTVIYDATLSRTLPVALSVSSGLNALAHCVDSLWAPKADPINQALALEGTRAIARALRGIVSNPDDMDAREQALYGCYLAAVSFASAGSGLHHKICHVLGGTFDLPHAETHATILPYVLALNAPSVPELSSRLAEALSTPEANNRQAPEGAVDALNALRDILGAPTRLSDYGFKATDISEAVHRILKVAPASNPAPVTEASIRRLLSDALDGTAPSVALSLAQ
ncbi:maleylacetate reductase [Paenarthrobacter sp. JL.01a]|uniref:maleylacetate reductase n=1 Tax=Paenarthrobacter sp. JL.01a TaxID=2979324 RepID=UPI0021C78AE7|nr:maleylacetate reductase [Paenarthrobacter sp. JL.01a]UXM92507.1 maleylacetate reductase [Paenarthrobacter sp. JL.01a]